MNVYIFQAALLCESCGQDAKLDLDMSGNAPSDPSDEHSFDSDEYPKGPFSDGGGESDSPQHCDECHVFLENPLTSEGYDYVVELVANSKNRSEALEEWIAFYDIQLDSEYELDENDNPIVAR